MSLPRAWRGLTLATAVTAAGLLPARPAAGGSASEKAAAEALFQEGAELTSQGSFADACPKFEASHKLDPALGTLLRLADCYDRTDKTASAWATFKEAVVIAERGGQPERANVARERALDLEKRLSKITLRVPSGGRPAEMTVSINGVDIPAASWETPLPIDPGELAVLASAPGFETWSTKVDLPVGPVSRVVEVSALEPKPPEPENPSNSVGGTLNVAQFHDGTAPGPDTSSRGQTQRILGFVTGGVGAASIVTSGVLTLQALSKKDESMGECLESDPNACSPAGKALRDDARSLGNVATVALLGGGALLTTGIVLIVTAPNDPSQAHRSGSLRVSGGTNGRDASLSLRGTF